VKAHAHFTVVDAMDLALLTGQRPADVLKIKCTDFRDGALWIVQNKTGARLGIELTGELAALIARIGERPRRVISPYLIQDENGQPLTYFALRSRFDKAREAAKVSFQFRDIRAKAATDTGDLAHSQKLLAHKNREMTEHYVKARLGASGSRPRIDAKFLLDVPWKQFADRGRKSEESNYYTHHHKNT
jgi:integrase